MIVEEKAYRDALSVGLGALVLFAVVATACCADGPGSGGGPDANDVRRAVIEAARACEWLAWPTSRLPAMRPEDDPYFVAITRVLKGGSNSLAALDELSRDQQLSRFQRRVAQIIAQRIRDPERFEAVDELLRHPLRMRPLGQVGLHVNEERDWEYVPRFMPPEMMTPGDRGLVLKHKEFMVAWERLRRELRMEVPVDDQGPLQPMSRMDWEQYKKEVDALLERYRVPWDEWTRLIGQMHVAPEYVLAWEEAAIRPISPFWKLWFARAVAASANPASAPTLGELYRQVIPFLGVLGPVSPGMRTGAAVMTAEALTRMPTRDGLLEVSEILREEGKLEREYHRVFTNANAIKSRLAKSARWLALLEEMKGDKDMTEHVDRVWAVIKPYVEYYRRQEAEKAAKQPATAASQPKPSARQ